MRYTIIFMVLAASLLIFGCITPNQPPANNTTGNQPILSNSSVVGPSNPITPPQNNSSAQPGQLPADYTANIGDNVTVDYTLRVDGKVLDTTNATLANKSGIYNPSRKYAPLTFTEEFNKGMIDGFIIGTVGMSINETLSFSVDPARGYGVYDPKKVIMIPRYYNKSLSEVVPRSYLESYGINISNGTGYNTNYGTVFIEDYNNDNVTIFYLLTPGTNITVDGIPQTVNAIVGNLTAQIEFALDVNKSYILPNPTTGAAARYKVLDKTNDTITLDSNSALANKTLDFQVTMLGIVPGNNPNIDNSVSVVK